VEQPRLIINTLSDLREKGQILRPQFELPLRTAEVETVLFA